MTGKPAFTRSWVLRSSGLGALALAILAIGAASGPAELVSPATAQSQAAPQLPAPPANGVMGFVVWHFVPSVIQGKDACPQGLALRNREIFLNKLSADERVRLEKKENEAEFMRLWRQDVTGPNGTNMCTHYRMFPERPLVRTVQSKFSRGLNLDGQGDGGAEPNGCGHQNFESPDGEQGIDNQAYRALGCQQEWRGLDGVAGDVVRGSEGFLASGEWTQVLLLRGVDSLVNDPEVEVIYANTADRPIVDASGKFIWNASYTVSTEHARERNVLKGKIVNGVLTTEPTEIKLTQTWGQGGARDLRGIRSQWTLKRGRLKLKFGADGSLQGVVGGYQPLNEFVDSTSMGGLGSLLASGSDCAGRWNTLKALADGDRDPKTGECTTISSGLDLKAVPAFVNDAPRANNQIASK